MCKLTKNLPIQEVVGGKGKILGVENPVGAMLWDIWNRVLCFMVIYYVHIPDPIIKLLVSVIQWSNIIWIYQKMTRKSSEKLWFFQFLKMVGKYKNGQRTCNLCLTEKLFIIKCMDNHLLNLRSEISSKAWFHKFVIFSSV